MNSKERFEKIKEQYNKSNKYALYISYDDIGFLLNHLTKQDKIIELMADMITELKPAHFKKEKGGELEKHYKHEQEYINGEVFSAKQMHFIDEDYISKDKIKEKIVEIINSSARYNVLCKINENEETRRTRYAVAVLKELLEEV